MKKVLWILCLVILAGATYVLISGLHSEMEQIEAITGEDDEVLSEAMFEFAEDGSIELDNADAFFVEYRMQRDRVRAQEVELLEALIGNGEASEKARNEAEETLLELVDLMEKELLIENMIKAQGYDDALFFYRNEMATVMVKTDELNDIEMAHVIDTVSRVTGVERETVQVLVQY